MTDPTECTCPPLRDLARLGLEGRDLGCALHYPTSTGATGSQAPIALNDADGLSDALTRKLGITTTTTLED